MVDATVERAHLEISEGIATVTLVRAERMNAFDEAMHRDLRRAFVAIEADSSVRAVILTGEGCAFSAGQDLGERAWQFNNVGCPDLAASLGENYNPLVRTIAGLPLPVIAAVNGIAFGAGASLAIACDIVLAAASARFQFGFVNVGLGPDSGASWSLPRLVGQARALELALSARAVAAEEAQAIGLVSRVVPDNDLTDTAREIAGGLASRSPAALAAIKRQLRDNPVLPLDAALEREREAQAELGRSEAYRHAVLLFARPKN